MTGTTSNAPPFRASDADRERVVRLLRDSAVEGRLAHDSFVRRVELALVARDRQALDDLVADLPGRRGPVITSLLTRLGAAADRIGAGPLAARLPALTLPTVHQPVVVIGRGSGCDLVLSDLTVSRVHAALRRFGDQWFLDDMGSTNGTRVNGFRIRTATAVRPGDRVGFGRLAFRIVAAPHD